MRSWVGALPTFSLISSSHLRGAVVLAPAAEGGTWTGQAPLAAYGVGPCQLTLWPLAAPQGCWQHTTPHANRYA